MKKLMITTGFIVISMNFILWNIGSREIKIEDRNTIESSMNKSKAMSLVKNANHNMFLKTPVDTTYDHIETTVSLATKSIIPFVYTDVKKISTSRHISSNCGC